MVTILSALRHVREDLVKTLDRSTVERLCREVGYRWRDGVLDPYNTLHAFILQVLNNNTAMTHLPHLAGESFTASAYCQARQRLPLELFGRLLDQFTARLERAEGIPCWVGHRVWLEDGTGFSMPDTPELQAAFGQPGNQKPGCGFPVTHMLALFDAQAGFLRQVSVAPLRTQDIALAAGMHPQLWAGDIIVGDRALCSYAHLALILQADLHAVFRIHQKQTVDFHPHRPCLGEILGKGLPTSHWVARLGHCDQLVEWRKPKEPPEWMTAEQFAALPEKILVREIKRRIREPNARVRKVLLVTTLLDPEAYPASEIARLYGWRWRVETDLRDLKITLGLDVLKGHSLDVVAKELHVFVLVYNLVRLVMLKAARRQQVEPHRISFIDALRWLQPPKPPRPLPALVVNPERPGRLEPRCIKRHMKEYDLMMMPRHELRKRLKRQLDAA